MGKIKKGEIEKGRACACARIQVTSNVTFTVGKCSTVARQRCINFLATRKYTNLQTASLLKKSYEYRSFLDEKDPTNLASKSQVSFVSHNFKILREIGIITFPTISKLTQNLTNSSFLHFFQNFQNPVPRKFEKESHHHRFLFLNLPIRKKIASSWLEYPYISVHQIKGEAGPGIEAYYVRYKRGGSDPVAGLGRWREIRKMGGQPPLVTAEVVIIQ